jgi:hypothetical protein
MESIREFLNHAYVPVFYVFSIFHFSALEYSRNFMGAKVGLARKGGIITNISFVLSVIFLVLTSVTGLWWYSLALVLIGYLIGSLMSGLLCRAISVSIVGTIGIFLSPLLLILCFFLILF